MEQDEFDVLKSKKNQKNFQKFSTPITSNSLHVTPKKYELSFVQGHL